MSDTPNYDASTGLPIYDPNTGQPAMDCCGDGPVCQYRWAADYCTEHHWVVTLVWYTCGPSSGPSDTGWTGKGSLRTRAIVSSTSCNPNLGSTACVPTPPEPPTDTPTCASSSSSSSLSSSSSSQHPGGVCCDAWLATYTCDGGGGGTWAVEYDYTFCSMDGAGGGPPGVPIVIDGTSGWWPLEGTSHFTYACVTTNYDQFCNLGIGCETGPTTGQPDAPSFSPLCLFCQYKFAASYNCMGHFWMVTQVFATCGPGTPGDTGWTGTGMMRTRTIVTSQQCEPGNSTACVMTSLPAPPTDTPSCPSSSSSSSSG